MKYHLLLSIIISFYSLDLTLTNISSKDQASLSCVGNAQKTLTNNRMLIYMQIESNDTDKLVAYQMNSNISNRVIFALNNIGVNNSAFETISFTLVDQYKYVFNTTTNQTDSVINGYKATNEILLKTLDLSNSGKIIDTIVKNGGSVSNINFDVTDDIAKNERLSLISSGIENCKNQIQSVVDIIAYRIDKYTSINIQDLSPSIVNSRPLSLEFSPRAEINSGPIVFSGKQNLNLKIVISANITRKNPK